MHKHTIPAALVLAFVLPTAALADAGFFVSAGVGSAELSDDFDGFGIDTDSTAWRLSAGYRFNDYVALEGGYHNFGRFEQDVIVEGAPVAVALKADGFTLGARASLPLGERFGLFARAGAYFWDGDSDLNGVSIASPEDSNLYFGLGLRYDLGDRWSISGDGSRFELQDTSSTVFSIGMDFRF